MRRMSSCARSGALGYYVYSTQSSHGTWLFPPNANQGGNSQPDAQSDAERPAPLPAFFVSVEVFLLQLKPRGALGFLSFCSGGRNGTVASASLGHSATRGRQSPFREAQEMADARLYHYCRDGAWSGRCMGEIVARGRAGMWSRAMWRGQPSDQPRIEIASLSERRHWVSSPRRSACIPVHPLIAASFQMRGVRL